MADYTEDELYSMSDEELESAFKEAKASQDDEIVDEEVPEVEDTEETTEDEDSLEEDEVDELEQPEEESDDDASTDDDTEEVEEEDSEDEEGELDGEPEEEDEKTEDEAEEVKEEVQPVQKSKFKANGREYEFTPEEIQEQFPKVFGQAMDYTRKMQALKPWRKQIDALEQNEVSPEQLNLMIDVLKGDKDAVTEVLKRTGIDTIDIDTEGESKYAPKDYGRDEKSLAIHDVINDIREDPEYKVTERVLSKDWDEKSWEKMTEDPEMIRLLHVDVKNGTYDKLAPMMEKFKLYDRGRKTDLEYYGQAAQAYAKEVNDAESYRLEAEKTKAEQDKVAEVKKAQAKRKTVKKEATKRKAAAPTKRNAGTKKATDYLEDTDEAFDEWYSKLQDSL